MKQIFITGASITYGVGGSDGGWADMIKRKVHSLEYGETFKEENEVYNFAQPGALVEDVEKSLPIDIKFRRHPNSELVIILSIGLNNAKSSGKPDGYISSLEDYSKKISSLLKQCRSITDNVIFVGYMPVNEELTNPKVNPFDGTDSFFVNQRIKEFDQTCEEICRQEGIEFVSLFEEANKLNWLEYLAVDGLHLNDQGHTWVFEKVWAQLSKIF